MVFFAWVTEEFSIRDSETFTQKQRWVGATVSTLSPGAEQNLDLLPHSHFSFRVTIPVRKPAVVNIYNDMWSN